MDKADGLEGETTALLLLLEDVLRKQGLLYRGAVVSDLDRVYCRGGCYLSATRDETMNVSGKGGNLVVGGCVEGLEPVVSNYRVFTICLIL